MNSNKSLFKKSLVASSIAAGLLATAPMSSAWAEEAKEKEVEVIQVVGTRAAWAKSLMTKKESDVIMESINATDIGKMPDANVAESLQRLTGIQITRNNGEGASIQIRGMSKNLLLLNDEIMLTGQGQTEGGMASLEEVPSELIGEIQVFKAARADLVEGGMGGTVNIITRKPLQLEDFTLAGNIKVGFGADSSDEINPNGALVIGKNWDDKFGFLVSLSSSERYKESNQAEHHRQPYADIPGPLSIVEERVDYPEIYAPSQRIEERKRIGSAVALQYRPTDSLDFTFDWVHNEFQQVNEHVKALFHMERNDAELIKVIQQDGRVLEQGLFTLGRQENQTQVFDQVNEADNFKISADWIINDQWRVNLDITKADAHETGLGSYADTMSTQNGKVARSAEERDDFTLRNHLNPDGIESFDLMWSDTGEGTPDIRLSEDLGNPEYHYYKSAWAGGGNRDSESTAIKLDFEYEIDAGPLQLISFGARQATRDVTFQGFEFLADYTNRGATTSDSHGPYYRYQDAGISDPGLNYSILDTVRFVDDPSRATRYDNFYGLKDSFGNSMDLYAMNTDGMRDPHTWLGTFYPGTPVRKFNDPLNKWGVEQDIKSVYLMADLEFDLFNDMFLTTNIGVRYVETKILVNQQTASPDTPAVGTHNWNGPLAESGFSVTAYNNDFQDVLPSFSANLALNDDMFVKFAASKTMARQSLSHLAEAFNKSYSNETETLPDGSEVERQKFISGSRGNPALKPDRTTAFDISYEWYFADESLFSAAFFYKDMTDVVVSDTRDEEHPDGDGVQRRAGPVTSYYNSEGGTVQGFELGLQHVFENGFGFVTNYTYSDGKADDEVDEDGVTGLSLRGLSEHSANIGAFYENDDVRANISYNWRSESIIGYTTYHGVSISNAPETPIYSDDYGQIDASVGYKVTENITLTAEVTNLFAENTNQYIGTDATDQFWAYYQGEARYYLGAAFKF